jgi:hypothetical protein
MRKAYLVEMAELANNIWNERGEWSWGPRLRVK